MSRKKEKPNKTTIKAMNEIEEMKTNKTKYKRYDSFQEYLEDKNVNDSWMVTYFNGKKVLTAEMTFDEYGLILDALYEQAMAQKKNKDYSGSLLKIAGKFEGVLGKND